MKIGFDNSYLFPAGNKNKLVRNEPDAIWTKDCTVMVRFTPDIEKFVEELGDEWRKAGCVIGKNGKHIGIFYALGRSGEDIHHFVMFEYWCYNEEKGDDDIKTLMFDVTDIKDSDYFVLHQVSISDPNVPAQRGLVSRTNRPFGGIKSARKDLQENHISIPGLTRKYELDNFQPFRYYRLKILAAEGHQNKVKIADFGLRDGNNSYAGFVSLRHST